MNPKQQAKMISLSSISGDEKGIVLPVSLVFLAILTLLGTTAARVTTTDIKIGGNYKTSEQAFYAAEAGIEEARERLRGSSTDAHYVGDEGATPSTAWSTYILTSSSWQTSDDPGYEASYQNYIPTTANHTNTGITANSLQTNITHWVKIRHKAEYDAEQAGHTTAAPHYFDNDGSTSTHTASSPGNIVYYGYGNPATPTTLVQFTTTGATGHEPVEILRAYGSNGGSSKVVEIEAVRNPGPPITSAVYAKDEVTGNGSSLSVDGDDRCNQASDLSPIYTLTPATTTLNGSPTLNGDPSTPQSGATDIDINSYVNSLKTGTTVLTTDQNGTNFGSPTNYVTIYSDTSNPVNVQGLKIQNGIGYGTLLVEGDLTLGGGFDWNGLILVTGTLSFNGGGSGVNIKGALLANQTVSINGGVDIDYDSCEISNSLSQQPLSVVSWQEVY